MVELVIHILTRSTRKKLKLIPEATKKEGDPNSAKFVVRANNIGNRAITITKLGIGCYKKEWPYILPKRYYLNPYEDSNQKPSGYIPSKTTDIIEVIEPHHIVEITYPFYNFIFYKNEFGKLYMFAEDADGKSYKAIIDFEIS